MNRIILKLILAGLVGFGLQSFIILIQYAFRSTHSNGRDLLIELGFPYRFYGFTPDYTFQIFSRNHLIYDAFVSFLFSFLIILIVSKMRRKWKEQSQPVNLMDDITNGSNLR